VFKRIREIRNRPGERRDALGRIVGRIGRQPV
jgi:hypothetical protein